MLKPPPKPIRPPSPHRIDPPRINHEKIVADLMLADANKAMASLFTDIRRLRRLASILPMIGAPQCSKDMIKVLDSMERTLAP